MRKLFVEKVLSDRLVLDGTQSAHLAGSLRMRAGDMVTVCDGSGTDYGCRIVSVSPAVELEVCYRQASGSEPPVKLFIYQAVPKGDKLATVVRMCTELGASGFVPVLSARCVSRPDAKSAAKKAERLQKVALEAAQQSGRGIVPQVEPFTPFETAVRACTADKKIIFYEGGGAGLGALLGGRLESCAVLIGPEGGFAPEEVALAESCGFLRATLGPRILRTETAPVCAASVVMHLTGGMEASP